MDKLAKVRAEIERRRDRHSKAKRIESALEDNAILSFIDSMQEESKVCMYSTANYTNADRLTLCKDCKELCRYNQKTAVESLCISQEAYDEIVDKCLYGSEVELVDDGDLTKEEPVSEDLEEVIRKYEQSLEKENPATEAYDFASAIRFGVNWQKQQMERYRIEHCKSLTNEQAELEDNFVSSHVEKNNIIPTFIDAIEYGIEYGKQQMLKNAVSGHIGQTVNGLLRALSDEVDDDLGFEAGNKVKLIIIKEV